MSLSNKLRVGVFLFIVFMLFFVYIGSFFRSESSVRNDQFQEQIGLKQVQGERMTKTAIQNKLLSPASAKFTLNSNYDAYKKTISVVGTVDAMNANGVPIRYNIKSVFDFDSMTCLDFKMD